MEAYLKKKVEPYENNLDSIDEKEFNKKVFPKKIKESKKKVPWVEKYRPKSVDEVSCQEEIISVLKKCIEGSNLPNLLFYGPPGTGKTSTIMAAAKDLFHDQLKDRVLELNASDERGIKVIREKVKIFAQNAVSSHMLPNGKQSPSFKIIVLDEADSMTSFAQAALKRIMEKECKTTRFCIICNYISRIIEPITSRCAKFRFKPLATSALINKLNYICTQEGVDIENEEVLKFIVEVSEGDMRKAITYLQSAFRFIKDGEQISKYDICEIAGIIPDEWMNKFLYFYKDGHLKKLIKFVEEFMRTGYSVTQMIYQLTHRINNESSAQESINILNANCAILEKCAEVEYRLLDGADEELQLLDLMSFIFQKLKKA
ncbi:unnamed protein product [Gordionus sp. m RMFG-2023]|uniref:replication factor C subunit 4-like n=1 Tax=Gordionus sp. m RMFG-2023 TaxID=3053472 RepID=UPI0030E4558E